MNGSRPSDHLSHSCAALEGRTTLIPALLAVLPVLPALFVAFILLKVPIIVPVPRVSRPLPSSLFLSIVIRIAMFVPPVLSVFAAFLSALAECVSVSVRAPFFTVAPLLVFRVLPAAETSNDQTRCCAEPREDRIADDTSSTSA